MYTIHVFSFRFNTVYLDPGAGGRVWQAVPHLAPLDPFSPSLQQSWESVQTMQLWTFTHWKLKLVKMKKVKVMSLCVLSASAFAILNKCLTFRCSAFLFSQLGPLPPRSCCLFPFWILSSPLSVLREALPVHLQPSENVSKPTSSFWEVICNKCLWLQNWGGLHHCLVIIKGSLNLSLADTSFSPLYDTMNIISSAVDIIAENSRRLVP